MKALIRVGISLIIAPLACLYAQMAMAQVKIQQSNFSKSAVIRPTSELRLKLDRLPTSAEGKLAFFIGHTDVTSQFRSVGTEFIYQPSLFPLPLGETKVIIYIVKGTEWQEIAQIPLKVVSQSQPSRLDQPVSTQPTQTQSSAEKPPPLEQKPTDKPTNSFQPTTEQAESAPSESEKPGVDGRTLTQSESAPSAQVAEEQTQKPTQLISVKPSTSAAGLSNSFQPQPLQRELAPKLEPIQAKPEAAADFTTTFKPRMNISVKSQFMDQRSGNTEASERSPFTDTTVETGFESEITRGTFSVRSRFSMLGVTFQPEALRFGELGEAAPKFDLSEYQIEAKWGPVQFSMGHVCYGNHPFLLSNVCSRGATLKVDFTDRIDLSINSMNATSIVGFDNFTGLDNFDNNNMVAATLGYQLIKNDFGGIRLEATVMDGKRPAENNFNEGGVVDAEKSRGFDFHLFGADNSGRLRIDVGYARSTFTNPPDRQLVDTSSEAEAVLADESVEEPPILEEPILKEPIVEEPIVEPLNPLDPSLDPLIIEKPIIEAPIIEESFVNKPIPKELTDAVNGTQELVVVPVKPVTKTAFYADISYDLLRNVKLDNTRTLSLTLNARHEKVDPQFQTLGATVTADQRRTLMGLNASIAGATIGFQQEWLEDNLANVPTVLKTKTRNTSLNMNVPLQTVLGSPSRFLPTLTYSYQRVQQFGANVPIPDLSAFDPTEIPNQINQQHQAGIQWTFDELSFGYQFSSSVQDNRQLSREEADFFNLSHQISLSWQPTSHFQLTLGYNFASAESREEGITRFNSSPTIGLSWEVLKNVTLALNYNTTSDRDSLNQKLAGATGIEAILTWRFSLNNGAGSPIPGSAFIRYSRHMGSGCMLPFLPKHAVLVPMRCHKLALFVSLLASLPAGLLLPLSIPSSSTSAVLAQTLQPRKAEADRLLEQGLQQFLTSQYREAIQSWEQALAIYRATWDRTEEARVLINLGNVYTSLSQYPQAIKYLQQALPISQQVGDRNGEAYALMNLGNVYTSLSQYPQAIKYHQQALPIFQQVGDRTGEASALINLGIAYGSLSQYPQAIKYFHQALPIFRQVGDRNGEANALMNLGVAYTSLSQYPQAIKYHQQALPIFQQVGNRNGEARALINLGDAYASLSQYPQAIKYHQQAIALFQQVGDRTGEGSALNNLGIVLFKAGNVTAAENALVAAISLWESVRTGLVDEHKVSIFEEQDRTYRTLQKVLIAQTKVKPALEIAERGRARAFVELLSQRFGSQQPDSKSQAVIQAPDIEQIQQIANAQNATLVQYSIMYDDFSIQGKQQSHEAALYIWVIQPSGKISFRQVDLKPLWQRHTSSLPGLIVGHQEFLAVRSRDRQPNPASPPQPNLPTLHQLLIAPIADLLPQDPSARVIFIPQGPLFQVPFPALQNAKGEYLIQNHTVLTAPAIQVLALTRQQRDKLNRQHKSNYSGALVLGNPTMPSISSPPGAPNQPLSPLPGAKAEANAIAALLKTEAMTGDQATEAAIVKKMPQARLIHLATHGLLDDTQGLGSAIALAPSGNNDGWLTAAEILDMQLQADLVVLSACNTAGGRVTGDGVIGLSRSLIAAGVPSVIVSLWAVPDAPTAELMQTFYQQWQHQPDKAQALRQAMLSTMKTHPEPRDWAAFTLIGEAE